MKVIKNVGCREGIMQINDAFCDTDSSKNYSDNDCSDADSSKNYSDSEYMTLYYTDNKTVYISLKPCY